MPEINLEGLGKTITATNEALEQMKEFARGTNAASNSLGLMLETMHRAHYSFSEFMSVLEKTNVVMYTTAKSINDVSQSMRGAVQSTESLISAFGNLSSKTMPELTHYIALSVSGYGDLMQALGAEQKMLQDNITQRTKTVDMTEKEILRIKEKGYLTDAEIKEVLKLEGVLRQNLIARNNEASQLDIVNEKMKDTGSAMEAFGKSLTKALGWITLAITATVGLAAAYDTAIKAKREVIYTLARMGDSYNINNQAMERFNSEFTGIANKWGMLREELAKLVAPMAGMGVGGAENMKVVGEWSAAMMKGQGIEAGITTKAMGVLATTLNISGKTLGDTFGDIASHGAKSVLGMQRYIVEMTAMIEQSRRFGGTQEGAIFMLDAFQEQVRKGTISMDSLVRMTTSATWSPAQQGAMISLMQQMAPEQARRMGIGSGNLLDNMGKLQSADPKDIASGIQKTISGLIPGGVNAPGGAFMAQQMLQTLTGVQVPLLDAVKTLMDPAKLEKAMKQPTQQKSLEDMAKSYNLMMPIQERMAGSVDAIRDMLATQFAPGKLKEFGSAVSDRGYGAFAKEVIGEGLLDIPRNIAKSFGMFRDWNWGQVKLDKAPRPKGKATGGYIPEDAEYYLHAGEQVSRPGEGGGGVSVSLGGLNIHVGDRGSLKQQLDEAFDRMKNDTLREVERQWNESLVAH